MISWFKRLFRERNEEVLTIAEIIKQNQPEIYNRLLEMAKVTPSSFLRESFSEIAQIMRTKPGFDRGKAE